MRVYVAGSIRDATDAELAMFDEAEALIVGRGWQAVNPLALDRSAGLPTHRGEVTPSNLREAMARDVPLLCSCDAIALLPTIHKSELGKLEWQLAKAMGLEVLDALTLEPWHETILSEAARLTAGCRDKTYGHPFHHFSRTAGAINAMYGTSYTAEDWARFMMLDKISRDIHTPKRDNPVDIAGYARCLERVRDYLKEPRG